MPWLLRDKQVLASVEVMETRTARLRGLRGRDGFDGAVLLRPARAVHTVGMRFPVDVAFCDRRMIVVDVVSAVAPFRLVLPRLRSRCVIEAPAGSFERWCLRPGDELEVEVER